eukprot:CAMPEP_0201660024 /NCGR_PEP_ID=MMETSP0494-20130426/2745_1 /ASSEMBLY_ACC=CAM_ASM_000839 /TAXON_ID=420259 /ORGANISM="Thalassiosira gravida, Strain GMp14c1" /LENGTH=744 /DNA_ID=CAMNT_0048137741 /DNA_START=290 /DNA_END=2524 /DNA_ORIENTATION=+
MESNDGRKSKSVFSGIKKGRSTKTIFSRSGSKRNTSNNSNPNNEEQLKSSGRSLDSRSSIQSDGSSRSNSGGGGSGATTDNNPFNNSFQEIGSRMKKAFSRKNQNDSATNLETSRLMSRKRRSESSIEPLSGSLLEALDDFVAVDREAGLAHSRGTNNYRTTTSATGYMQLRAAHMLPHQTSDASIAIGAGTASEHVISAKLLEISTKNNFCDIEIIAGTKKGDGDDDEYDAAVVVKAPSFLLAAHSIVFEEIFYPKKEEEDDSTEASTAAAASTTTYSIISPTTSDDPQKIYIEFASQSTIEAVIHFCATLDLPPDLNTKANELNVRTISQLHLFAQLFKIHPLINETYRTARRMMNKDPSLVCAAFDECNVLLAQATCKNNWGLERGIQKYDDLKAYALGYLRESPLVTLMGSNSGLRYLSESSIEAVICDQLIDVDEFNMWYILNSWVKTAPGTTEAKLACAQSLSSHIQLVFIDPLQLKTHIKKCGFVDPKTVEEALMEIKIMLENESPDDMERVIVEGAGDERVNGVYVLADAEVGLKTDEVIFLKEGDGDGDEDDDSDGFGLFLWGDTWGIASSMEYFNVLYSCDVHVRKGHSRHKPPKWGWKCDGGTEAAPTCTWKPSKGEENSFNSNFGDAPALTNLTLEKESSASEMRRNTRSHCGNALAASLTLSQMMALPEDADFHEDHCRYASGNKDLDAMMNLRVDEGHDDEEAGYNVNYLSATLFCESSSNLEKADAKPS